MQFTTEEKLAQHEKINGLRGLIEQGNEKLRQIAHMNEQVKQEVGKAHVDLMAETRVLELMEGEKDVPKPE